jgi:N-acetylneuraminate synthase
MSPLAEIDAAVQRVTDAGQPVVVLQCTSAYPAAPEVLGLNLIDEFRARYGVPVGLSDHSGTIFPGLAAAALGIAVLEVHLTLSRQMFGPDVSSSLTPDELAQLVEGVRFIHRARSHPVDKDAMAEELAPLRALFTKSVVATRDLEAGTVLTVDALAAKKPGTGIPASRMSEVIGQRLRRSVVADEQLQASDLEAG